MLHLIRVSTDPEVGTFGVLRWSDEPAPFAVTCENPWRNNEPNVSCIPAGLYDVDPVESPRFGRTYQVQNVPGRTHILFHRGNTHVNTQGCILVGEQFEMLQGVPAVIASKQGFAEFLKGARARGSVFKLLVEWVGEV